ncbi:hypothetical protein [Nostoc sp.]
MNDGKTYQDISKFLDIAYPTVAYWAVHGDPDNLESFLDGRREGNFRKVTIFLFFYSEYPESDIRGVFYHMKNPGSAATPNKSSPITT